MELCKGGSSARGRRPSSGGRDSEVSTGRREEGALKEMAKQAARRHLGDGLQHQVLAGLLLHVRLQTGGKITRGDAMLLIIPSDL